MCGMKVVVVNCDEDGNVDLKDLKSKVDQHAKDLAALMVTYPSTHGEFEEKLLKYVITCISLADRFIWTVRI